MMLNATVHPGPNQVRILVTEAGDDCLKAVLPSHPAHPRALHTLLEGLAQWHGRPVHAALVVDGPSACSRIDALVGEVWPRDLATVRFEIRHPRVDRRRIRGPGDFRQLYLMHGEER